MVLGVIQIMDAGVILRVVGRKCSGIVTSSKVEVIWSTLQPFADWTLVCVNDRLLCVIICVEIQARC